MALLGSLNVFGITIPNAYLRLGGVSGGKQSGYWQADVQVFHDGGAAAQAYEATKAAADAAQATAQAAPDDEDLGAAAQARQELLRDAFTMLGAARVHANLPLVTVPYDPSADAYAVLYSVLAAANPTFVKV